MSRETWNMYVIVRTGFKFSKLKRRWFKKNNNSVSWNYIHVIKFNFVQVYDFLILFFYLIISKTWNIVFNFNQDYLLNFTFLDVGELATELVSCKSTGVKILACWLNWKFIIGALVLLNRGQLLIIKIDENNRMSLSI